ncbi:MAG TPA: nuclear transport factor 2 family protein [Croceibacterium sp.]|nr:nuclear transport factor 2 family protein [Croceibacterium sp.]
MKPAAGALPWNPDAPPFDPRDTANREQLSVREVAERFIQLFYVEDNPRDAFMSWMHPDYIQHNPNAPTGRDATLAMMEASLARLPDLSHEVKRVIWGDADLVAIHFHFKYERASRGYSVVDILRIDGGYIREHWDVMQEVPDPATAKNSNGMF